MKRYLVYDSHCAKCTQIANSAQELAGSKLVILSVHSSEAIALLNQAHPNGWRHAPYLVEVDDKEHVKAWTGTQAVVHLINPCSQRDDDSFLKIVSLLGLSLSWHNH